MAPSGVLTGAEKQDPLADHPEPPGLKLLRGH